MFSFLKKPRVSDELRQQVLAVRERGSHVSTVDDALAVARDSALLTDELLKSIDAGASADELSKAMSNAKPAAKPAANAAANAADDYDPDAEAFEDDSEPEGDEWGEEAAPVAPPRPQSAAPQGGKLRKSLEYLTGGDEAAMTFCEPLFKSIEATEVNQAVNADYLEQIGEMLSKSLEGLSVLNENVHRIAERQDALDEKLDQRSAEQIGTERANFETLQKSIEPMLDWVQNGRQSPVGTPIGRAKVSADALSQPLLGDAAPGQQAVEESYQGFSRGELKKSVEAGVRSGHYLDIGLNPSHFNAIVSGTPLEDLPPVIYDVASKELKRPIAPSE